METETMGRVTTEALIENYGDLWNVKTGALTDAEVRRVVVTDALVDTGASILSLPTSVVQRLGLQQFGTKRIRSSTGVADAVMYGAVRLTIQGRDCVVDVMEVPEGTPTLIGQIPLEHLDFVVDLRGRALVGNPLHGGEHMYELY